MKYTEKYDPVKSHRWLTSFGCTFCANCALMLTPTSAWCQESVLRWDRLASAEHRPIDELDHPRYRNRSSRLGWEVRTDRFVVLARSSAQDAEWTSRQLEAAWMHIAQIADHWTTIHRDPRMAIAPVYVIVDDEPNRQRLLAPTNAPSQSDFSSLYFSTTHSQPSLENQLGDVRSAAVRSFLQMTQMHHKLPVWVQDGLVEYIGQAEQPTGSRDEFGLRSRVGSLQFSDEFGGHNDPALAYYLLEGNDAIHAPKFFAAIRQTLENAPSGRNRDSHFSGHLARHDRASSAPWQRTFVAESPLGDFANSSEIVQGFGEWTRDTQVGQPLFDPDPKTPKVLLRRQQEILLLLKLARRFPQHIRSANGPATTTWGVQGDRDDDLASTITERPVDLDDLYARLLDRAGPDWATIDVDGSLLLSTDRQRVKQLVKRGRRCRGILRNDALVLVDPWNGKTTIEAWLEDNADNPQRPLARVNLRSMRGIRR